MALDSATGSVRAEHGETTMRAVITQKIEFDGDASYATGGSLLFEQFVRDVTGDQVTVTGVSGYGITAGTMSHLVHYDAAVDGLLISLIADGVQVANAVDLSGTKFHLMVFSA